MGDSSIIKKGETVVAIGSPLGIKNTVSTGVLSGRLMEDNMDVLQFTAPISSGSSGGALFDNNGNVIGITYASYIDGQNLNLAIPVELANNLYNSKGAAKSVSAIYTEEHPYITQLIKFKNTPTITIDEFLKNYKHYDGETVKIIGYISSIDFNSELQSLTYFIAPATKVSGNVQADIEITDAAMRGDVPYQLLYVFVYPEFDSGECFMPADSKPGDPVCLVGRISYFGYESGSGFLTSIDLMYPLNH